MAGPITDSENPLFEIRQEIRKVLKLVRVQQSVAGQSAKGRQFALIATDLERSLLQAHADEILADPVKV